MEDARYKEKMNLAQDLGLEALSIIKLALKEDLEPSGDISSMLLPDKIAKALIIAKEPGIMACSKLPSIILDEYCKLDCLKASVFKVQAFFKDGDNFQHGKALFEIEADIKTLLATERTILNFLQRLCGIATYTHKLVKLIENYDVKLLDTRKTMPGMRALEKAAFVCGGGTNHRFNLSAMVMLKENHLAMIDDLGGYIKKIRSSEFGVRKIEVEINKENLDRLEEAINASADQIMLDNFSPAEIQALILELRTSNFELQTKLEASGGINESNLIDYAKTGVDYISTSISFTKANNIDLSMLIEL